MIMKKYMTNLLLAAIAVIAAMGFTACSDKDSKYSGDPYFQIEGLENLTYNFDYQAVDTTAYSSAKKLVVRCNRPWKLVCQDENGWCRVFPAEGDLDGIIRLSVNENKSPDTRTVTYKIYVDGQEFETPFTVVQTGAEPYIKPSANSITISRKGGETQFSVIANVPYEMSILPAEEGGATDWLAVEKSETDENTVVLKCGENPVSEPREVILHVQGTGAYAGLSIDVPVTQLGALYFENFSWMNHSDTSILGWNTDGESNSRFDKWTEEELSHGWTCRSTWCYGRPGFLKLGKTSYGGDLVSPKISEIQGTMNVAVSMQLVGYCSAGGTLDDTQVYVAVLGPGTITGIHGGDGGDIVNGVSYVDEDKNTITLNNVASFVLTSDNHFNPTTDPDGLQIWLNPNIDYTIDVDGATNQTQIVILGGVYDADLKTVGKGKNRIFVDNFKVEER